MNRGRTQYQAIAYQELALMFALGERERDTTSVGDGNTSWRSPPPPGYGSERFVMLRRFFGDRRIRNSTLHPLFWREPYIIVIHCTDGWTRLIDAVDAEAERPRDPTI